jgi:hypothetical protein
VKAATQTNGEHLTTLNKTQARHLYQTQQGPYLLAKSASVLRQAYGTQIRATVCLASFMRGAALDFTFLDRLQSDRRVGAVTNDPAMRGRLGGIEDG